MNQAICIMGDVEGDWKTMMETINEDRPDMVLQVGDFGYWPGRPEYKYSRKMFNNQIPIYFCDGNHEDHKNLRKLCKQHGSSCPIAVGLNLFYMPRGSVLTLPDGRNVLFMGGAESVDKRQRTPGYDWFQQEIILPEDIANLPSEDTKVDIVISHTSTLEFQIVPDIYAGIFASDPCRAMLSQVLQKYQPDLWYFGHFHN
ncbi:MAG: metallophosphoesterase, partial [Syntrophomonadaceae bacterium]|nr:metallophosphoesterase [Syntrophomonadaceae bacterium]